MNEGSGRNRAGRNEKRYGKKERIRKQKKEGRETRGKKGWDDFPLLTI